MCVSEYHLSGIGLRFPSGEFGIPMHHPRFLEWIGVPQSASLLEMVPGRWLNALSQDKAMVAAIQLQRDVCLMQTNLDILDQYALSLQGTASKLIERSIGASDFPSAEVAAGGLGPLRCRSGGYGAVAALAGPYTATLGRRVSRLVDYDKLNFHYIGL